MTLTKFQSALLCILAGPLIKMDTITFDDLGLSEEFDTSFLTEEQKQILVDVRRQAMLMSRKDLEDWIVLPYFELIKQEHLWKQ